MKPEDVDAIVANVGKETGHTAWDKGEIVRKTVQPNEGGRACYG